MAGYSDETPPPTIKDSTQHLPGEGAKRKAAQASARAARKREAKRRKFEAEQQATKEDMELL